MAHKKYANELAYESWRGMRQRCGNPNNRSYKFYGGRGITYCERWEKFENFLADMGSRPKGTSIDRIDSNGNYEPSNCRWQPIREQHSNKRNNVFITFKDQRLTLTQWSKLTGIHKGTIRLRYSKGWPVERILGKTE
jgi:hypothetical protein